MWSNCGHFALPLACQRPGEAFKRTLAARDVAELRQRLNRAGKIQQDRKARENGRMRTSRRMRSREGVDFLAGEYAAGRR